MNTLNIRTTTLALLAVACASATWATPVVHLPDATQFLQATSGSTMALQDFQSYAVDTPLTGAQILPGVTVSATSATFGVRLNHSNGNRFAYAPIGRSGSSSFGYDLQFAGGTLALALDVVSANPNTGPITMTLFFGAGAGAPDPMDFVLPLTNPDEFTPMFVGFLSDTPITALRYREGLETNGLCCEETGIDRIRVQAAAVPEPTTSVLCLAALAALGAVRRWRGAGAWA